jgi:hypothetical protein
MRSSRLSRSSLRRQLWGLRLSVGVTSLALAALATSAYRRNGQGEPGRNLGEITVERINVVDRDGTLRMVISDKDRMHPGVIDGKVIDRPRPFAGVIFFNDDGDEVGGLTYSGKVVDGRRTAHSEIAFDQLKQDQTIGMRYVEGNGQRSAALEVWDRRTSPLSTLIDKLNAANKIADPAARAAAVQKARAEAPPAPRRVYLGKGTEREARLTLADANGTARLNLIVDAAGNPRIEFLDDKGGVVQTLPK